MRPEQPLPPAEQIALARAAQTGSKSAAEKLVRSNLGAIYQEARLRAQRAGNQDLFDDLVQEGLLAVAKAIPRFDCDRPGACFLTFAMQCARNRMARAVTLARSVVARKRDVPRDAVISTLPGDADELPLASLEPSPESVLSRAAEAKAAEAAMDALTDSERTVARLRFVVDPPTLEEVASILGVARQTVHKTEQRAKAKIRKAMAA